MKVWDALYFDSLPDLVSLDFSKQNRIPNRKLSFMWAEVKDMGRPKICDYSETAGISIKEKQQSATCKLIQTSCVLRHSVHPALTICNQLTLDKWIGRLANLLILREDRESWLSLRINWRLNVIQRYLQVLLINVQLPLAGDSLEGCGLCCPWWHCW